ncbi:hypothetical protein [Geitlerinema sp. PCC 7407]|uniref:hypothetical protein n=1 Tax=Geitlerinema sp. PCC 7407 TaxID=1173025 RepID=UPI00029FBC28|nr:hypothetical protein [Geitlerinema sp. PCC 7407]AFY64677.1 hypothetical protein GEI7407_0172 [Geitlerinema sp. PCC 7407]
MTQYCNGDSEAEIIVDAGDGFPLKFKSTSPPVTVLQELGNIRLSWSGKVGIKVWAHPAWGGPLPGTEWVWDGPFASPKNKSQEIINLYDFIDIPEGTLLEFQGMADNEMRIYANSQEVLYKAGWGSPAITSWVANGNAVTLRYEGINAPGWEGNPYNNPAGMSFAVSATGLCKTTISDGNGIIWEKTLGQCPEVTVTCGGCCKNQSTLLSISSQIQSKLRQLQ